MTISKFPTKALLQALGFVVGALLAWLAIKDADAQQTITAISQAKLWFVVAALFITLACIALRTLRWRLLIGDELSCTFWQVFRAIVIGQAANLGLPVRLGDATRIVALSVTSGESTAKLTATVLVERWLDSAILLLSLALVLPLLSLPAWLNWWEIGIFAGAGVVLLPLVLLTSSRTRALAHFRRIVQNGRINSMLDRFLTGFAALSDQRLLMVLGLSAIIWAASITVNLVLACALGHDLPIEAAAFVLVVVTFGAIIPSTPLRIGAYQYLCILALAEFGIPAADALPFGIVLHAVVMIWPLTLGTVAFARMPSSPKPAPDAPARRAS